MKVTSRGRPFELVKCIKSYLELADNPNILNWLFTFDVDDLNYNNKPFIDLVSSLVPGAYISFGRSNSKIHAINRDVEAYTTCNEWHILLNISDDQLAIQKGWDTEISNLIPNSLDASLWFSDGWQDRINTQEILGFNYYNIDKYIYHPEFKSFFCDNLSTEVAKKRGKLIKSNKCIIKHYHPGWSKDTHMKHDETYNKCTKDWKHDEDLYNKLKNEL